MSSAAVFKSFRHEANVLFKNVAKKSTKITIFENLVRELFLSHFLEIREYFFHFIQSVLMVRIIVQC